MSELGDFLKSKRAAIAPESVGLPAVGNPRRVRGLRREEVAQLATMSVDHYTRLEQGRVTTASDSVLNGIATALRLTDAERTYLHILAQPPTRSRNSGDQAEGGTKVGPLVWHLLDAMRDIPAMVIDPRGDIVAWNPLAVALYFDFAELPPRERNMIRMLFLEPRVRAMHRNWEEVAAVSVARMRMSVGLMPGDRRMAELVSELLERDADFRKWWGGHEVLATDTFRKSFDHPVAGWLLLDWQALSVAADPDLTMIVFTAPPGSPTADSLRMLASWAAG
ncbi:helix-turn-helix domain-containing protein [Catenulispora sp. NF23]|uniref:Helix-turn-helix domain-containing protein n=1 Tax=Catenulispora pinistramenti TaxID=2705254 RepID=A0ABS5KKG1_9ACTN|nr:helix-turn-helix transcriptional regulator [Catenulispora pinistramenti]MBS2532342.1 helix-turn-helix domain-containing protein [Catenulispora pinistramenti]MBS2546111.1 helix-turn-helix domain-containing protein [Catenulispora pinistramenti]